VHTHLMHAFLFRVHIINGISLDSAVLHRSLLRVPNNGPPLTPSKSPIRVGNLDPHLIRGSFPRAHPSLHAKRHLNRFIRFCNTYDSDGPTDRPTDRRTDHATPSVTIGRIYMYVCSTAMRPKKSEEDHAYEVSC